MGRFCGFGVPYVSFPLFLFLRIYLKPSIAEQRFGYWWIGWGGGLFLLVDTTVNDSKSRQRREEIPS